MSVTLGVTTWSLTMSLDYCTSKRKEGECTESPDLEVELTYHTPAQKTHL